MYLSLLFGAAVGVMLGLTGAGGGVLAMPLLVMYLGLTPTEAAPISLLAVALAATVGAASALRKRQVRYRAAIAMALAGALLSPIGLHLARLLPARALVVGFCIVMLIVGARMLAQVFAPPEAASKNAACPCLRDPATGRFRWTLRCSVSLAGTGAVAGLFTGMLGVGGGFLIVPALRQFTDVEMPMASATSLAVIAIVSSFTSVTTLVSGVHIPLAGWSFIAATVLGLTGGRSIAGRVPAYCSQVVFSLLVFGIALSWLFKLP